MKPAALVLALFGRIGASARTSEIEGGQCAERDGWAGTCHSKRL